MIIVQVAVRPRGSMQHEVIVAEVEIINDESSGDEAIGNYTYVLQTFDRREGRKEILHTGRIEGINRNRSALHVLAEVLDHAGLEL